MEGLPVLPFRHHGRGPEPRGRQVSLLPRTNVEVELYKNISAKLQIELTEK